MTGSKDVSVRFYETVRDDLLKFVVIVSRHEKKWVFCRHRDRATWECPGGHREAGETVEAAARRELWEETGAEEFSLVPVCVYSVQRDDGSISDSRESFGMLYSAEILRFGALPPLEIEETQLFDRLPENWTYPQIQPLLFQKIEEKAGISHA